ncbi:Magnesium-dependent phosphatase 1 [Dermatophagoides pteronyssinus]|uniref:Magnesium-dependent phosphatase 1 n=1 Tax=Dermatophagoides pteronyssinus TaxID=6956 RepID=A0ABQ8J6S1_DERPT|nr:Magnesium-dependent phosphatase 1 [Dermatophagoides pteronyssinus]
MAEMIEKIDNLKLIVFDLDYTLWPFWVDTHVTPPFRRNGQNVYDAHGILVKYYPEVPAILERLKSLGYRIGIASRTSCTDEANDLLRLFKWDQWIDYKQIYPGCKITHITKLSKQSDTEFNQILFFDDEQRNIIDLKRINVCSILVDNGMTFKLLKNGIDKFKCK